MITRRTLIGDTLKRPKMIPTIVAKAKERAAKPIVFPRPFKRIGQLFFNKPIKVFSLDAVGAAVVI